jgi:hypothetical protein
MKGSDRKTRKREEQQRNDRESLIRIQALPVESGNEVRQERERRTRVKSNRHQSELVPEGSKEHQLKVVQSERRGRVGPLRRKSKHDRQATAVWGRDESPQLTAEIRGN